MYLEKYLPDDINLRSNVDLFDLEKMEDNLHINNEVAIEFAEIVKNDIIKKTGTNHNSTSNENNENCENDKEDIVDNEDGDDDVFIDENNRRPNNNPPNNNPSNNKKKNSKRKFKFSDYYIIPRKLSPHIVGEKGRTINEIEKFYDARLDVIDLGAKKSKVVIFADHKQDIEDIKRDIHQTGENQTTNRRTKSRESRPPKERTICKYWLQNKCDRHETCTFLHVFREEKARSRSRSVAFSSRN